MDHDNTPILPVESLADPRIAVYRNLKDGDLSRQGERFIAEGELVVRRLLESDYPVESVLLADRRVAEMAPLVPPGVPVYAAPAGLVSGIVGFGFHCGVIACGRRRPLPALDDLAAGWGKAATLVVLPEITNTENLGALLRISAAFGADAVVLGRRCCDPFYRQSIRVSMGTVFRLRLVSSADLAGDLERLRRQWGFELAATVAEGGAESLAGASRAARLALLFGNEAQGLPADLVARCDRRITIPMKLDTDSLNVAVAAGIFLHHFTAGAST